MTLTNVIPKEYTDKFVVLHLDDVLEYRKTQRQQFHPAKLVLEKLRQDKLSRVFLNALLALVPYNI